MELVVMLIAVVGVFTLIKNRETVNCLPLVLILVLFFLLLGAAGGGLVTSGDLRRADNTVNNWSRQLDRHQYDSAQRRWPNGRP